MRQNQNNIFIKDPTRMVTIYPNVYNDKEHEIYVKLYELVQDKKITDEEFKNYYRKAMSEDEEVQKLYYTIITNLYDTNYES